MLFVHRQNDLEGFRVAKLHHNLSTHAAGSCIFCEHASLTANDTDCLKFFHAFAYCLKKSGTLRTVCGCISGVFNVTACVNLPVLCKEGCAYCKIGIWCIGIFQLVDCCINQLVDHLFFHFHTSLIIHIF